MYKLIPLDSHCIVEVVDFPLPEVDLNTIEYVDQQHYYSTENSKRMSFECTGIYENYFRDKNILPKLLELFKQHPLYSTSTLAQFHESELALATQICKDQVGWQQEIHTDHPVALASGLVHITDCATSTKFYNFQQTDVPLYTAPCKANSGAFWLNTSEGYHGVDPVTVERNHFFFLIKKVGP